MKKISVLLFVLVLGLLLGGCGAKPYPKWKHIRKTDNQLKNPNFELVSDDTVPYFWAIKNMRSCSKEAEDGKFSVRGYSDTQRNSGKLSQNFDFVRRGFLLNDIQNGIYSIRFGGYQKGSLKADETGHMSVTFYDKNDKFVGKVVAKEQRLTNKWIKIDQMAKIPSNAYCAQFNFYVTKKNGSFEGPYVDNVFIYMVQTKKRKSVRGCHPYLYNATPSGTVLANGVKVYIKGWGYDATDGSRVEWDQEYPSPCFDDVPGRRGSPNAAWQGDFFLKGDEICFSANNLFSQYPPAHTLRGGYEVELVGATFSNGKTKKVIPMFSFRKRSKQHDFQHCEKIILK